MQNKEERPNLCTFVSQCGYLLCNVDDVSKNYFLLLQLLFVGQEAVHNYGISSQSLYFSCQDTLVMGIKVLHILYSSRYTARYGN